MTPRNHFIFWTAAFAAFLAFVFVFKSILLPFVLGMAIAYLLNPLVHSLRNQKLSRGMASLLILCSFLLVAVVLIAAVSPVLYEEMLGLLRDLPGYIDRLWALIEPFSRRVQAFMGRDAQIDIREIVGGQAGAALGVANKLVGSLVAGGAAALNIISLLVITPVVAYFMMKEWPHIIQWVKDLMPRDHKDTIMGLLGDIDRKMAGFIRGQLSVAFILAVAYAVALSLAGLKYGFLIGFSAGLLSIIPMLGSVLGLVVSVLVAWFQSGEWSFTLIIAGIFLFGQFVEGNFLTPKLVGKSVGLHPLWVFFALMAGGALFGIVGMLLAVPVAAAAGVLAGFAIRKYKESPYYRESEPEKKKKS